MGLWAIVLIAAVVLFRGRLFPNDGDMTVESDQIQTPAPPVAQRLVGQWRRATGGYILDIKAVHDDGKVDAAYLNPRPIHVSQAKAVTRGGFAILVVTLKDRGYPGNMYTLTYDPDVDCLKGVYHHRGLGQQFDVEFSRLSSAQNAQE